MVVIIRKKLQEKVCLILLIIAVPWIIFYGVSQTQLSIVPLASLPKHINDNLFPATSKKVQVKSELPKFPLIKPLPENLDLNLYDVNNYGPYVNVTVRKDRDKNAKPGEIKKILMWNEAYGDKQFALHGWGREGFYRLKCPETRCEASDNRQNLSQYDAVLLHQRSGSTAMPPERHPHQRWVMWNIESGCYPSRTIERFNGFNWTMTFRSDSDIHLFYGYSVQIREHPPKGPELDKYIEEYGRLNADEIMGKRNFSAAWFVSNCRTSSQRENYGNQLQNFITIRKFGSCGTYKCPRSIFDKCKEDVAKTDMFYLAFENSLGKDYVTEKFIHSMKFNILTISMNSMDRSLWPEHSYIDTRDYPDPEKLGQYLKYLKENPAKYAEYFWWRDFYEIRFHAMEYMPALCELCQKLHNPNEPVKWYNDMSDWWIKQANCQHWDQKSKSFTKAGPIPM